MVNNSNESPSYDVKYAGLIPEIALDLDPTGRTEVLRLLDKAKLSGHIPSESNGIAASLPDSTLTFVSYTIHVTDKSDQSMIMVLPLHQVASVGLIVEPDYSIVCIKIGQVGGNTQINDMCVLYIRNTEIARSLCNQFAQCFQSLFSEATNRYTDQIKQQKHSKTTNNQNNNNKNNQKNQIQNTNMNVNEQKKGDSPGMRRTGTSASMADSRNSDVGSMNSSISQSATQGPSFISGSRQDLTGVAVQDAPRTRAVAGARRSSTSATDSTNIVNGDGLIQDYMQMLFALLTPEEIPLLANLFTRWRSANGLQIGEFAQKALEIYGPERKHLLTRMRPFVDAHDLTEFESFLVQQGINDNAALSGLSWSPVSDHVHSGRIEAVAEIDESMRLMMTPPTISNPPIKFPSKHASERQPIVPASDSD